MSNIRLYTFNQAVQDATVITATSENSLFPISNIKDPRTTKVSRSITGVLSNAYTFDMVVTNTVDSVLVVPDSIRGFAGISGDITIKGNIIDSFGSPPFTTTLTPNDEFGFGFATFADKSFRFWQLSFSNTSDFAELSKVFIGRNETPTTNNIDFGWRFLQNDNSRFRRNRYKQKFVDKINQTEGIRANFNLLNKAELDSIMDAFNDVKESEPMWAIVDSDEIIVNDAERFAGYFYLRDMPDITNRAFSLYDLSFTLEQAT